MAASLVLIVIGLMVFVALGLLTLIGAAFLGR